MAWSDFTNWLYDTRPTIDSGVTGEDITNINPYTDDFAASIQGLLDNFLNQYQDSGTAMEEAMNKIDPEKWISDAMSLAGGTALSDMVNNAMTPYRADAASYADSAADAARKKVADSYSGGNLYSGAFGSAVGGAVGDVYSQAAMQESSTQANLSGSLMNQILSMVPNTYAQGAQLGITGAASEGANTAGMLNSILGAYSGISQPEYFNPYMTNPNYGSSGLMDVLSLLVGGADALSGFDWGSDDPGITPTSAPELPWNFSSGSGWSPTLPPINPSVPALSFNTGS